MPYSFDIARPDKGLPRAAGVGLKAAHMAQILEERPNIGWFEIHPENYMGAGGMPHRTLSQIREHYALSIHGVGLSIGGAGDLDTAHLDRLKSLIDRYQPHSFSEHLAWSTHQGRYFNDLLAAPYTSETLQSVCDHVEQTQDHLGRTLLLENPATYIAFEDSTIDEIEFLQSIARKTGCGLLLDVNNVFVSCTNHKKDPQKYIEDFPHEHVGEIHLAGHASDKDDAGALLLIDAHDRKVCEEVWTLYDQALAKGGAVATLIEWDNEVPSWSTLFAESQKAQNRLDARLQPKPASSQQGVSAHGLG